MSDSFKPLRPPRAFHHRLPTLSASQVLNVQQSQKSHISTGSPALDAALGDNAHKILSDQSASSSENATGGGSTIANANKEGIPRAKLTEICGPPGSGKTSLASQVAANALQAGEKVTWIETAQPLPLERLIHLLSHIGDKDPYSTIHSIQFIRIPTLAHLLAVVLHPPPTTAAYTFLESGTSLLVVDNISTLFSVSFPPGIDDKLSSRKKDGKDGKASSQLLSGRRLELMKDLVAGLEKLAAMRNIAILIVNQMTTRIVPGAGAFLQPAVASAHWTNAFSNRLLLYRHDVFRPHKLKHLDTIRSVRYVSIMKAKGMAYDEGKEPVVAIVVGKDGIGDVEYLPENENEDKEKNLKDGGKSTATSQTPPQAPQLQTQASLHSNLNTPVPLPLPSQESPPIPIRTRHTSINITTTITTTLTTATLKRKREIADSEDEDEELFCDDNDESAEIDP